MATSACSKVNSCEDPLVTIRVRDIRRLIFAINAKEETKLPLSSLHLRLEVFILSCLSSLDNEGSQNGLDVAKLRKCQLNCQKPIYPR
jgi:hypothetical protein